MRRAWAVVVAAGLLGCAGCGPADPYAAIPGLRETIAQLTSDDPDQQSAAAERLVALGDVSVLALAASLAGAEPPLRIAIAETLGDIGGPEATSALIGMAREPDEHVRAAVMARLGRLDDARVGAVLEAALNDPSAVVHLTAAGACGTRCASPGAIARLVDLAVRPSLPREGSRPRAALRRLVQTEASGAATRAAIEASTASVVASPATIDEGARAAFLRADAGLVVDSEALTRAVITSRDLGVRLHAIFILRDVGESATVDPLATALREPSLQLYAFDALRGLERRGVHGAVEVLAGYAGLRPAHVLQRPNL